MDDGHGSEHRINNYAFPAEVSRTRNTKKHPGYIIDYIAIYNSYAQ